MITADQLQRFCRRTDASLVASINTVLERFQINTPRRVRYFLTQAAFETQMFSHFEEDLYYSTPERLVAVWPKRFTMDRSNTQLAYAPNFIKNPEKLSNYVYGGRNGNKAEGDGWRYRGRGGFHLTFRNNYQAYSQDIYGDDRCVKDPDLVALNADALLSAGWFWDKHGFNYLADADQFSKVTTEINGSSVTVPKRLEVLKRANQIF